MLSHKPSTRPLMGSYCVWKAITTRKPMKQLFAVCLFIFISFTTQAMGNTEQSEKVPFAKSDERNEQNNLRLYEIFVPKKNGDLFLTEINLYKENEQSVSLKFEDAHIYPDFKETYIVINPNLVNTFEIYLNYSTTKDGGLVMCGGNRVKLNINDLLFVESPPEVIPPPRKP